MGLDKQRRQAQWEILLDRIFDNATVFTIKGYSFRGRKLETATLQTSKVTDPTSPFPSQTQEPNP